MGYSAERTFSRRRFLISAAATLVAAEIEKSLVFPSRALAQEESPVSIQEIFDQYPEINPAVTAVNLSLIPHKVEGIYTGFHHLEETLFKSVPFTESGESLRRNNLYQGLQEAIQRHQPTFLIIDLPYPKDNDFAAQCSTWEEKMIERASFFNGASANFIIGNELNTDNSPWDNKLDIYFDLYLQAERQIRKISPGSRVFPWQEAYNRRGELIEAFLRKLKAQGGSLDGLPINFYDISSKMEERVLDYRRLLDKNGFPAVPIIISELSKPEDHRPTPTEKASFVIQHLATAAYLQKQGVIERAAWFSGWTSLNHRQDFALSTTKENGQFLPYPALTAFILCQHLLTGEQITLAKDADGLVKVDVFDRELPKASFLWNEGTKAISLNIRDRWCRQVLTPTGVSLSFDQPLTLLSAAEPKLGAGDSIVLLYYPFHLPYLFRE